jgi:YfiH family protein
LKRFFRSSGFSEVISLKQIHSDIIRVIDKDTMDEFIGDREFSVGDGLYTQLSDIVLMIKTADCVPVIMVWSGENRNGVMAVSILHAGWRGILAGIVEKSVKLFSDFNQDLNNVTVIIGPSAGNCCYEVSGELADRFEKLVPGSVSGGSKGYFLDLKFAVAMKLMNSGISRSRIFVSPVCTICSEDGYPSYRREGEKAGRMISFIGISDDSINKRQE